MAPSSSIAAGRRFAATLVALLVTELALFRLEPEQLSLVFPRAWRQAVEIEKPHHAGPASLILTVMLGIWLIQNLHPWGWDVTNTLVGQAELQSSALGLPILNDVMLDVPNPT